MNEIVVFDPAWFLIAIDQKTQKKLADVRKELASFDRKEPKPDMLRVKLY